MQLNWVEKALYILGCVKICLWWLGKIKMWRLVLRFHAIGIGALSPTPSCPSKSQASVLDRWPVHLTILTHSKIVEKCNIYKKTNKKNLGTETEIWKAYFELWNPTFRPDRTDFLISQTNQPLETSKYLKRRENIKLIIILKHQNIKREQNI